MNMERLRYITIGWVGGLGVSFLLWELGARSPNKAIQASIGILMGIVAGYFYYRRFKNTTEGASP